MSFIGSLFDREFARQALAEKRLTRANINEILGAQMGLADRGIQRAIAIIAHELDFLSRHLVEQLVRQCQRKVKMSSFVPS